MSLATGQMKEDFTGFLVETQAPLHDMNITAEDLGKSFHEAYFSIAGFKSETKEVWKLITSNQEMLEKMGVSSAAYYKTLNLLSINYGKNMEKATKQVTQMALAAREMGISSEQYLTDFAGALSQISNTGARAAKEFQNLAFMAKQAGVAVNDLLGVAGKFDTFKEAADWVAYMNGTLGTNFSSIELMQMDMDERVQTIREGIMATVADFDQLDRATQLMIAQQIAGGDLQKARGMLGAMTANEAEEYAKAEEKMKNYNKAMDQLKELLPQAITFFEEMRLAVESAFKESDGFKEALKTIINHLPKLIDGFIWVINHTKELIIVWGGLKLLMVGFGLIQMGMASATAANAAAKAAATTATITLTGAEAANSAIKGASITVTTAATGAQFSYGTALWYSLGAMIAFAAILLIAYGIWHMTGSPALWEIAGIAAIGVIAFGAAMYFAGPAVLTASAALAGLMIGLAALFYTLPPLVESIGGLMTTLTGNVGELFQVALGIAAIATALIYMGSSSVFSAVGIGLTTAALGLLALTVGIGGSSFDEMKEAGAGVMKVGIGIEKFASGISTIATTIGSLKSSLSGEQMTISVDSDGVSLVAGKDALFASLKGGSSRLVVDVNMPEPKETTTVVRVLLDGDLIEERIQKTINDTQ